jgi:hypothetical protein
MNALVSDEQVQPARIKEQVIAGLILMVFAAGLGWFLHVDSIPAPEAPAGPTWEFWVQQGEVGTCTTAFVEEQWNQPHGEAFRMDVTYTHGGALQEEAKHNPACSGAANTVTWSYTGTEGCTGSCLAVTTCAETATYVNGRLDAVARIEPQVQRVVAHRFAFSNSLDDVRTTPGLVYSCILPSLEYLNDAGDGRVTQDSSRLDSPVPDRDAPAKLRDQRPDQ